MALQDDHLLELSKRFTREPELWDLGLKVLKLHDHQVSSALTKHKPDVALAAHELLRSWRNRQTNRQEAYPTLHAALREGRMQHLAAHLKEWVEGTTRPSVLSAERLSKLQYLTKQSLRTKPFCLAIGKEWTLRTSRTDLREIYTDLSWTRKHRKAYNVEQEDLKNITEILSEEELGEDGPVRILVQAVGGMGKSTAMKHLALSWADGTVDELNKFQFVFHIALKHVKSNITIEEVIIAQHNSLEANNVKPAEIKSILEGETDSKVLLLVDGHDEYKCGINTHIDRAIEKKSLWNCWMVVTSRETEQIKDLKQYMDAEAEIRGFDGNNIEQYITRALESESKTKELLTQAKSRKIYSNKPWSYQGIMTIPLLLHMICVIFVCNLTLPKTKTGVMKAIVDRCMNRESIRAKGQKAVDRAKRALFNLGKLAWQGLDEAGKKLIFDKEEVIRVAGEEALELGLLFGTERMSMEEEETDDLCFPHLMFQEFAAAIYISQQDRATLENLFPTWRSIRQHIEVIRFACATAENPDVLLDVICDRVATDITAAAMEEYMLSSSEEHYNTLQSIKQEIENTHNSLCHIHNKRVYLHVEGESYSGEELSKVYLLKGALMLKVLQDTDSYTPRGRDFGVKDATGALGPQGLSDEMSSMQEIDRSHLTPVLSLNSPDITPGENRCQSNPEQSSPVKWWLLLSSEILNSESGLRLLEEVNKFQNVTVYDLEIDGLSDPTEDMTRFLSNTLRLSRNVNSVKITGCRLPEFVYQHLTQQLYGCNMNKGSHSGSDSAESSALEILHLYSTAISQENIKNVLNPKGLTRLRQLNLSEIELKDCLGDLLGAGLHSLEKLVLHNANLNNTDLSKLAEVIRNRGLSKLKVLILSFNTLTGCLGDLLSTGLPSLKELSLSGTKLSKADLSKLAEVARDGGLLNLKELNLSANTLTDCLGNLPSTGLPSLVKLNLQDTELNKGDLSSLTEIVRDNGLLNLKELNLSYNTLTGCLGNFLGVCTQSSCDTHHPGFPNLEDLSLKAMSLDRDDILALSTAVQGGRLPRLKRLGLRWNNLHNEEESVEIFIRSCVEYYKEWELQLHISFLVLYGRFINRMKSICSGSKVNILKR